MTGAAAGASPPAPVSRPGPDPIAARVFAALVLACFAAFFVTQHLKHTATPVQEFRRYPVFSPTPRGHLKEEAISFKVDAAQRISVRIVTADGDNVVATLAERLPVPRYKKVHFAWDGRRGAPRGSVSVRGPGSESAALTVGGRDHGRPAPAGEYRVRVELQDGRQILSPDSFTLVR